MHTIPVFPLNLVVFPGSRYQLHIFEEQYKILVQKSLKEDSGFGIVAPFDKKTYDVGVYVKIDSLIKEYERGESDIVIAGIEKFIINDTYLHPDGYYMAEIEKYDDDNSNIDDGLITALQDEFEEIIELVNYKLEDSFWSNFRSAKLKSYKIAEKSGLSYEQQMELLILKNENARLSYLIDYFLSIKEKVSTTENLKRIIMNNGYLN